ncbi:hypothetical protein [Listeria fleischmannii]|jgi:hypothetical protein|uniref:Uncharacterized protein n=2 Tax=Listeria fleischmannii TaxID=1069827 RepID=W7DLS5_9LIST|nr:hypothetical protein [Listeria fleischmannii]MBC1406304.1 hypothetical protein [Listeria welshimeri]EIA20682.1 hypothetical protein KKC_05577 [Listeria fleischmannii subsp. coloradonensis]EUJ48641.1 hypothetical protein MCOL2_16857 [Listeria fleischmannii FSL S10-1203]MBC1397606.1 hypothetical protein [Listeria fleischmannii]MBC1417724.1 hypothetical protein [Listeria fleischmannii]
MKNKLEMNAASLEDIKQLEELFMELGALVENSENLNEFERLVRIELKLDEYRLKQTLVGQKIESAYAMELETVYKNA